MDLRQLEILRAVADSGSFTNAGQQLRLSQSAVSRQILLLEAELKEQMFLRIGRKIRITAAGTTILGLSRRVFEDLDVTRANLAESRSTLSGTVRLVGGMTACLHVFPMLIKEFRREYPAAEVKVTTGATARLVRKLRTGAADLGLLTLPIDDPALVTESVMREELLLVTAPMHAFSQRRIVEPGDLKSQPFVLFEPGGSTRSTIEAFFKREGLSPKIVAEAENVEVIKALVRAGVGVTIVPYQAVAKEVRAGQLFASRIAGPPLVREIGWVCVRSARMPRAVQEMKRMLETVRPRLDLAPDGPRTPARPALPMPGVAVTRTGT